MIFKRTASDFMTGSVIVANTSNTFDQVMEFFITDRIHHLPVADQDTLIGIISVKDMLAYIGETIKTPGSADNHTLNKQFFITKVMTPNPVTVSPETPLKAILEILAEGKFQAVPVVSDGIIRGIITNKDITRIYHYDATHLIP